MKTKYFATVPLDHRISQPELMPVRLNTIHFILPYILLNPLLSCPLTWSLMHITNTTRTNQSPHPTNLLLLSVFLTPNLLYPLRFTSQQTICVGHLSILFGVEVNQLILYIVICIPYLYHVHFPSFHFPLRFFLPVLDAASTRVNSRNITVIGILNILKCTPHITAVNNNNHVSWEFILDVWFCSEIISWSLIPYGRHWPHRHPIKSIYISNSFMDYL